jgi:flavin-dependent dehydrogenase
MRAGLIPVGGPVLPNQAERVLLIGDAAGLVSPLTAGGIHLALESGQRAAGEIAAQRERCGDGRVVPLRPLCPPMRWKRLLRRLFDLPLGNGLLEAMVLNGLALRLARLVFFYRKGFRSVSGWRGFLTRPAMP